MTPLAARIYQALELLQEMLEEMDEYGELRREDMQRVTDGLNSVIAAFEYEQAVRDEACDVACDKGAARKEC